MRWSRGLVTLPLLWQRRSNLQRGQIGNLSFEREWYRRFSSGNKAGYNNNCAFTRRRDKLLIYGMAGIQSQSKSRIYGTEAPQISDNSNFEEAWILTFGRWPAAGCIQWSYIMVLYLSLVATLLFV
eukprot:scaffold9842_cov80-Skeletonema_menzelii.AAC.1